MAGGVKRRSTRSTMSSRRRQWVCGAICTLGGGADPRSPVVGWAGAGPLAQDHILARMDLRQMEAIETHSGYDFPHSPTKYIPFYGGAEYHDYYHYVGGQSQSNFASVFTYCDYKYGTDKGYRYQKQHLKKLREQWRRGEENRETHHSSGEDQKIK